MADREVLTLTLAQRAFLLCASRNLRHLFPRVRDTTSVPGLKLCRFRQKSLVLGEAAVDFKVALLAKLTAHTPGVVLNRHLRYDPLARKALAFGHG